VQKGLQLCGVDLPAEEAAVHAVRRQPKLENGTLPKIQLRLPFLAHEVSSDYCIPLGPVCHLHADAHLPPCCRSTSPPKPPANSNPRDISNGAYPPSYADQGYGNPAYADPGYGDPTQDPTSDQFNSSDGSDNTDGAIPSPPQFPGAPTDAPPTQVGSALIAQGKVVYGKRLNSVMPCFDNVATDYQACADQCTQNTACQAWTFTDGFNCEWMGTTDPVGLCYLMTNVDSTMVFDAPLGDSFISGWM